MCSARRIPSSTALWFACVPWRWRCGGESGRNRRRVPQMWQWCLLRSSKAVVSLDREGRTGLEGLPVPQPTAWLSSFDDTAICPCGGELDLPAWPRSCGLLHSHDAADQGFADLSANPQSASRTTAARTYQAGEHRAISRHRGRRCTGDGRRSRSVTSGHEQTLARDSFRVVCRTAAVHLTRPQGSWAYVLAPPRKPVRSTLMYRRRTR